MESIETIPKIQHDREIKQLKEKYKPNNVFNIDVTDILDFFKWWCVFLRPFIPLTDREIDVVASLLKQRWELFKLKDIKDQSILDALTMSSDTLDKVVEECKITKQHFYVVMSSLKKKGVINGHINPRLIPNMKEEGTFKLTILFKENTQQA
jgi:hypothetical protein